MKTLLIVSLSFFSMNSYSQIMTTWLGNTPGHEAEWNCASNWSDNRIPDEFSDVVIPVDLSFTDNYPVIRSGHLEINTLSIRNGGNLRIEQGDITILSTEGSFFENKQVAGDGKLSFRGNEIYSADEWTSLKNN